MSRIRQAVEDDVPELVRLRALLFEDLGGEFFNPSSGDEEWRHALATVLKEQLGSDAVRVLVVDSDGGLAACGIGTIEQRLPGPHLRNGRIGLVIGVVTDPAHRRRGHSRAIMHGLLDWFRERGAARVDLHASHDGEPLYRALGFTDHPDPALYWRP
ncbi:GNAT family N-acetyltransferase [Streptomyces spectabilis]|uniref:GNAT family N-acetyltransferase n=1 Tax=Streptomyces spectabilis TaxID=68270 RepID=A0A5P2X0Q5_STRST|nr:GNAT family N-acetyltransferase [Streptomyces spectabilis]MBB5101231.1 GNAT superfamily N-acetyltransferase [Streptomyces spectabilis]MCI3900432.1 GNAT family N-acetyltransferase [Streptomyces spectabilis]QEV58011.1 GNAT family N-acetyltransferase [Streptomyces spectabilis]GGV10139.1 N-acetyltransferase [Streptomyces spectabilis]